MLVGKSRTVRGRVVAILLWTAGITFVGAGVPAVGARLGLWGWPQSSSWFGVLLGFVGGGIVFFEMALVARKWWRGRRLLPAKWWMWAHIWLGLICLPVILVHGGLRISELAGMVLLKNYTLANVTMALFLLVIASGVWGLVVQQWLPSKLLQDVPGETIASEIDRVGKYHSAEATRLIEELLTVPPEMDELLSAGAATAAAAGVVGSPSPPKAALGPAPRTEPLVVGPVARDLENFRDRELLPYLAEGRESGSILAARGESDRQFARLRDACPADARPVLDRLEDLCDLRRRWDTQERINWWLHNWLLVHLPLSVLMTGLMVVHAVRGLKYW